jgi:3-oxoadipate enol-lactonase
MAYTQTRSNGTIQWLEVGDQVSTVPVVLLHGFPHDAELWSAQVADHATSMPGTRLLLPDLPGFGGSAPLTEPNMDGYADAIAALLDAAGVDTAVIGGLSMGGYVAFAFWRRHAARVRALILMDTKAEADTDAARLKRRELITTVEAQGVDAIVDGLLPGQLGKTTRASAPRVVRQVEAMLRRAPATGVIGAASAMMSRPDSTPTLASLTVPTLIVVGSEDVLTPPSDAMRMAAGIPGSRLVIVANAGHLAPLEQPAVVNAAISEFFDVAVRGL